MKINECEEIVYCSGATYSSKLIEATQNALKEAAGDENTVQENTASESTDTTEEKQAFLDAGRFHDLKDGICTGTADAFRGDVEVQVTVENQRVTDISSFPTATPRNTFSVQRLT